MANTKTKSMTISEMASVTGVTGASITALVNKWKLKPTKTGQYNRKYYSAKDTERIINYYKSKAKTKTNNTRPLSKDDLIESLREQVKQQQRQMDIKDDQINELNEQLKMAQINLNQSQQLQLKQVEKIKQLEAPSEATGDAQSPSRGDDGKESEDVPKDAQKSDKRSIWSRLFGSN